MLIEKDTRQRTRNQPMNANPTSAGTAQSPYRQSLASRNDGRPPTRPITPIKSAQAHRYHHGTASNTSQITNSMIGGYDESGFATRPPNLGLQKQQTDNAPAPFNRNNQMPMGEPMRAGA